MPRDYHRARADILEAMPGTVPDLATRSGYARGTVKRWIAELRKGPVADRGAHIGEWLEQEGRGAIAVAVWHAGPGPHKHRRRKGKASSATKYARAVAEHGLPLLAAKAANQGTTLEPDLQPHLVTALRELHQLVANADQPFGPSKADSIAAMRRVFEVLPPDLRALVVPK